MDPTALTYRSEEPSVVPSPLPQSVGYGVVVAAGLAFAFGMMSLTAILKKTLNEDNSKVETFMVANRTVQTGLVASAVVSSWLWGTALLSCVLVTYSYGISSAFWYGAGCSTAIVFFGYLGTVCKGRVPEAHTILEVIRIRYGTVAHLSFTFLAIVNNLLNTINMILGASAAISFLTGMHIMASTFLLPLGVVLYTLMDTGYFLKAFAASPSAVVPGYVLGGISYLSIPWSLGTVVVTASLGLEALPIFPTYPRLMTGAEVTNGLALPYMAVAVAGKGGAVAVLLMTFMAVTSTLSAQILAVSSILTFDIYRVYFNQEASNKQVIRWGHIGVVFFGVIAAAFTAMFHYIGVLHARQDLPSRKLNCNCLLAVYQEF
nr:hypothetical protein FVER53263_03345 [Fusarium verticillioides]